MVKKAHLVTGKGGVGKSLIAAALANRKSLQNRQILLTEFNEQSFYKEFLSLPQISYEGIKWNDHFYVSNWAPEECLREYALHLLKIPTLYKLFFENPVSKSLVRVAPGLQELALLGKLTSSPRNHGPAMNYDEIVVDCYSTGHFLSLLRAPGALSESIPLGPMGEQTKSINNCIRNPQFTYVYAVCLAEELPVQETVELYQQLRSEFEITPKVIVNKLIDLDNSELSGVSGSIRLQLEKLLEQENTCLKKLTDNQIEFVKVPLVTSTQVPNLISKITDFLEPLDV